MYLCVALLFTIIVKAENIDINCKKKNEKRLVNKKVQEIRKGIKIIGIVYIKMKWRQDWDMNETL